MRGKGFRLNEASGAHVCSDWTVGGLLRDSLKWPPLRWMRRFPFSDNGETARRSKLWKHFYAVRNVVGSGGCQSWQSSPTSAHSQLATWLYLTTMIYKPRRVNFVEQEQGVIWLISETVIEAAAAFVLFLFGTKIPADLTFHCLVTLITMRAKASSRDTRRMWCSCLQRNLCRCVNSPEMYMRSPWTAPAWP